MRFRSVWKVGFTSKAETFRAGNRPHAKSIEGRSAGNLNASRVQVPQRVPVARAFGQNCPPQAFRFLMVAAFSRKLGQVASGDVAKDSLIDACKFLGPAQ
jgi:hypothetical protein